MKKKISETKPRNCNNCKWKSKEHSYPDWQKHTRKCINFPHNDFIDWEPIGPDGGMVAK